MYIHTFTQRGKSFAKKTNRRREINAHMKVCSKKLSNKRKLNQKNIDCFPEKLCR